MHRYNFKKYIGLKYLAKNVKGTSKIFASEVKGNIIIFLRLEDD